MIRVADYLIERLAEVYSVNHIFMIVGGGAMHLNDAVGKCSKIKYICNHHEQATSLGAEGYTRASGKIGVSVVTTGPGGTNTVTGILGQWTDSIPSLYISGQIKFETSIASCQEINLRQLGDQEANIVDIVKPITKYAKMIVDPLSIKRELDKAMAIATCGRPGPVWLDIPLNVQAALINEEDLYESEENTGFETTYTNDKVFKEIIDLMQNAKRPLIIAGQGIRIAKAKEELLKFAFNYSIPIVTTFNGMDLIENDNKLFVGRIGTLGSRSGNFALQNSDLAIFIGTRNNIRQVSYNWQSYARCAKKIIVDIDKNELMKPTLKPDIPVCMDAKVFLEKMNLNLENNNNKSNFDDWLNWCNVRKNKYPLVIKEHRIGDKINPYVFIEKLTSKLKEDAVVVTGNGTACVATFQAAVVKKNTRMFWNSGSATMGYDLPASIGACFALNKKEIYCITGDGSIMMNIQELMTIAYHNLPIKIILLNNDGYISMRQTQGSFFDGRQAGSGSDTGVGMPDFVKVAEAFGIKAFKISELNDMDNKIEEILEYKGPVLFEVVLDQNYKFMPKLSSVKLDDGRMISKPLEDIYPFLDRDEFKSNMIVPILEE